ncbi:MAG TPA: pentapeptide repeat-containing protein [Anaerolineales bacterium]|jgi:hypothetical protein|nr:pentapeptide repeat-containing protein [Anaerolineales bacterium]HJO33697.1 pentapeptide repeat-containing protein [Anaerolineales bacterium]|tara:strand:- start:857 stop:1213 length:357 start_codon:yes stop_codon:yes gene_type:complete
MSKYTREEMLAKIAAGESLEGADLSGANLGWRSSGDSFRYHFSINLEDANLCGANLSKANLQDAKVGRADLRMAYLSQADLREAKYDVETERGLKTSTRKPPGRCWWKMRTDPLGAGA